MCNIPLLRRLGSLRRARPYIAVFIVEMELEDLKDVTAELERFAILDKTTIQSLADRAACDEIWRDMMLGKSERDRHVSRLTRNVQDRRSSNPHLLDDTREIQDNLQLPLEDVMHLRDMKLKTKISRYVVYWSESYRPAYIMPIAMSTKTSFCKHT